MKVPLIKEFTFSCHWMLFLGRNAFKEGTRIRPIQRDGGQRLEGYSGNIFWDLREARYDAFQIDERLLP